MQLRVQKLKELFHLDKSVSFNNVKKDHVVKEIVNLGHSKVISPFR